MITISLDPIIFSIGQFHIRWYSLILVAAITIGFWLVVREAGRKGFNTDEISNNLLWIIFAGLVGARLFHVVDHWSDEFAADPIRIINLWEGGLAVWGAIIGGLAASAVLAYLKHWKLPRLLDALVPGVVLAQAIGRVACIITGDAVGKPTTGPFGFAYTSPNAIVPQLGVYYTPTPVYEILMNLFIFSVLWNLRKKNLPDGALTLVYLSLYSLLRFFIAATSAYNIVAFGLNQAQLLSALVFIASLVIFAITAGKSQRVPTRVKSSRR
jgi:phosphatidylglycerol:prolipoprotein diacylglycerol transferase